jgi:hypothetical protein
VTDFWTWAAIVGLSMTPNLILGPSVAVGIGINAGYDPWILVPVVAIAAYAEGLALAWLAGASTKLGFLRRWLERMRKPKVVAFAHRWGPWGGLTLGCAALGQEPILVALRWLGVPIRRLWFPLLVSNVLFAVIYYAVVWYGLDRIESL